MQSIYALGDPRTGEIRYVGIAQDVYKRYAQHLNRPHLNGVKNAWMAEIKQAGIVPTLTILESNVEKNTVCEREKHWIQHYLNLGMSLTNIMHVPSANGHRRDVPPMQEKSSYTLRELFDNLPISLRKLGTMASINEVTLARIRDGQPARRSTLNRLLREMGKPDIYDRPLSLTNVTGVTIQGEQRDGDKSIDEAA